MSAIINGSSPSVTFSDGTTQATSAIVSGYVPYANLPAGSVVQVVQGSTTATTSVTSGSLTATSLSATITPKSATNKILILITASCYIAKGAGTDAGCGVGIYRNGSQVFADASFYYNLYYSSTLGNIRNRTPLNYLDSPASISALTYTLYIANYPTATATATLNTDSQTSFITLLEVVA